MHIQEVRCMHNYRGSMLDQEATSPWAFMVEENSVTRIHSVRLTIVNNYPICIQLGHTYNPRQIHINSTQHP